MSKIRRRLLLAAALALATLSVVAVGGVGLLRSNPSWYARVKMTPDEQAAGQRRLLDRLATLHNQVGQSQVQAARGGTFAPLDIRITEDEVNGAITRWYDANAGFRNALGEVTEPHVRFLKDRVEVAGRSATIGSLISIELTAGVDAAGAPTVQLGRPYAGRIPLSRVLVDGPNTVAKLRAENKGVLPDAFLDALGQLLDGDVVAPPIVAVSSSFNGEQLLPARVEKLTLDGGELVATLRPFLPPPTTKPAAVAARR